MWAARTQGRDYKLCKVKTKLFLEAENGRELTRGSENRALNVRGPPWDMRIAQPRSVTGYRDINQLPTTISRE
jgi:hypothetical protein